MPKRNHRRTNNLDLYLHRLNRYILGLIVVFIPLYILLKFTQNESIRVKSISDVIERIKEPVVWSVPEKGVRYTSYFKGVPDEGNKFVLIDVEIKAMMKIGFPVVPRCFRLVDDTRTRYYPRTHSPFFIAYGDSFYMEQDATFNSTLLFEIPLDRKANNLLFDRYQR